MHLPNEFSSDVLVAGAGLAGIMAAIKAAECGCSVTLAAGGGLFSGSSFYPGTWGFGLVGPKDDADCDDLIRVIEDVGCGMAAPSLVNTFVRGIRPAIDDLRAMGVKLREAENKDEREFIPCFDKKQRDWHGLETVNARVVFAKGLDALGIKVLERCEILKIVKEGGQVCGVVAAYRGSLRYFACKALVLATGGYGSIFKYHLCTKDVSGTGQALALEAGCSLVNMEFMQMMPGYISPAFGTVFNEKTFRYATLSKADGNPLFPVSQNERTAELLDLRSTHGPFTSRLPSKEVDLALFRAFLEDERGVRVNYSEEMRKHPPEFIGTYFDWLRQAKGLGMADDVNIGIFSHAANGGVMIDENAYTGVPGLFACGEVTGGVHGADRIGGLSTANGLVFGIKAGNSAAEYAKGADGHELPEWTDFNGATIENTAEKTAYLKSEMFKNAMVIRNEAGLSKTLEMVKEMLDDAEHARLSDDAWAVKRSCILKNRLITARCVLTAALNRRESRGSHYREDYPEESEAEKRQIILRQDGDHIGFNKISIVSQLDQR